MGSAVSSFPGIMLGGWRCWKQKRKTEETALWKCDEQRNVSVLSAVGRRSRGEEQEDKRM